MKNMRPMSDCPSPTRREMRDFDPEKYQDILWSLLGEPISVLRMPKYDLPFYYDVETRTTAVYTRNEADEFGYPIIVVIGE